MWGGLRRWLGTAQQSLTAQGGALAAVNSNQVARYIESLVCFFVSETFLRLLLQGFRSASEPSRPPERRARWSLSHLALALKPGILVESQAGPDGKLARVRGPRCPRQPVRHARAAQRVRGLPTAAQSCRAKLCCASRPPVRACPALSIRLGPQFDAAVFHALTGAQEGLVIEYNWVLGPSLVSFARLDTAQSTT